jgi:hypothetical protein
VLNKTRAKLKKRYKEEPVKKGRATWGAIYSRSDNGREIRFYLAFRRSKDIFRDGENTITEAMQKGKAIWALDYDTLLMLRAKNVTTIGIFEHDSGEIYWTTLPTYFDATQAKPRDYRRRGGANQRYLPFHRFQRKQSVKGGRW